MEQEEFSDFEQWIIHIRQLNLQLTLADGQLRDNYEDLSDRMTDEHIIQRLNNPDLFQDPPEEANPNRNTPGWVENIIEVSRLYDQLSHVHTQIQLLVQNMSWDDSPVRQQLTQAFVQANHGNPYARYLTQQFEQLDNGIIDNILAVNHVLTNAQTIANTQWVRLVVANNIPNPHQRRAQIHQIFMQWNLELAPFPHIGTLSTKSNHLSQCFGNYNCFLPNFFCHSVYIFMNTQWVGLVTFQNAKYFKT